MKTFVAIDPTVKAVQYVPGLFNKGHEHMLRGLRVEPPSMLIKGGHYYIQTGSFMPKCWMALERKTEAPKEDNGLFSPGGLKVTLKDGTIYFREVLSFNFWDVKGEQRVIPLTEAVKDYALEIADYAASAEFYIAEQKEACELNPQVFVNYQRDNHCFLSPGYWVIQHNDGTLTAMSDADFKKRFRSQ